MDRSKLLYSVAAGIFLALAQGCSSTSTLNIGDGSVTPELIHERVRANLERIHTVSGTGTISVESPEMAGSGSFEIALRRPDSLLLKLEGPFGIEVGAALVTRTDFLFYNSLQNQIITGATNSANLGRYMRMHATFDDLMNLFAGAAFFATDGSAADEFAVEGNQYVLTYHRAGRSRKYWIDPTTLLIAKVQHFDSDGNLTAEQQYNKYRASAGGSFPSNIRLLMRAERRALSIYYDTVELNATMPSFALDIPPNAKHIRIE